MKAVLTVFCSKQSPRNVRIAVLENSRKFPRKKSVMVFFFNITKQNTSRRMVSWYFPQIFQISYSKEHPLTAASEIVVVTVFVLRSSRSEVVDNCSEKSEKTPRNTSVEVYFFNFN